VNNMDRDDRCNNERAFTDVRAEKRLAALPDDLELPNIGSFENLRESIHYLQTIPAFCGDGWVSLREGKSGSEV